MRTIVAVAIAVAGSNLLTVAATGPVRIELEWPASSPTPAHAWTWGDGMPAHLAVSLDARRSAFDAVPKDWDVQVEAKKNLKQPRLRITNTGDGTVRYEVEVCIAVSKSEETTIWLSPNYSYELNGNSDVSVRVIPRRTPPRSNT